MFRSTATVAAATAMGLLTATGHGSLAIAQGTTGSNAVVVDGTNFALNGASMSYVFHANSTTGDLVSDHFGATISGAIPAPKEPAVNGWVGMPGRIRREFPDQGRGDFRIPAVRIRQTAGYTVSDLQYQGHEVVDGKPALPGLPATFGEAGDVTTLVVHLYDNYSAVAADLSYSVFPEFDAVVRSVNVTNKGKGNITIENLASLSVDFPLEDLDLVSLRGDWAREANRERRRVEYGIQGFGSSTGYSSHLHNPFFALVHPSTTESQGEAWGFNLVYTGSFSAQVEKGSQGLTRALIGFNPDQLSWNLGPGETLTSPECVSVYSKDGIGGMSRKFHRLYRKHLIRSKFATSDRPPLLNSWEGVYFDFNQSSIETLAEQSAALGIRLFVMDDGWFGDKYPRTSDNAGLGDWTPNPDRFPNGLEPVVEEITNLTVNDTSAEKLRFGIWVEPEMVNPNSSLYREHPDWALHAGAYARTERRNQLVLNLALPEVQEYIIDFMTDLLNSADISYIKWDNNRGIHEAPSPSTDHEYMLGVYRVFDTLTARFPDVLWEGCASGGGRFDAGVLHYFPQIWTSDNTDGVDRVTIQFGTSLAYPPSAMGAHLSAVPNHQTGRTVPLEFRAHVAMMGGSFGLELDPATLQDDPDVPELIQMAEKVNPLVLNGDLYRLRLPEESQWPAALFVAEDGSQAVLFYFQLSPNVNHAAPWVRLQGLDPEASYTVDGDKTYTGATLMNLGLQYTFDTEYGSKVVFLERQ
ncbi:AGLC_ASPNG Alpha-galactosidase C precursor (Melibiase) [Aspergillus nidulans FGSC A4]|uniref:Alpha-galactosidase C n=1 Tax=Emericella nidulans (strain FGSC A4 / ATCC 38163 / CBS 112.46 / NRRL 194 / M139) TaxID=227321 RepID=AGALC_EMENI|nr:alpha-galactosidase C [Aspergillus nidulans FGSC A4]Q5AU92.1 RecName: Full=Alpha-galactosidase C; AltName: Full=Melibiase C; Flags: Precursor [Aspergillus nidulans FGSC A4]ABF50891.1 alpha-galactosidase [Aspergillus nidulans]EAA58775.1 AGLC_ASPNG Alpha-galactosidase C precursor (Melibiase) [Aspergillus nidulans FGSC A4]CBF73961.1 TPA: AGLC_ASPNG Alpha-galactosidase C (Melibiase)Alpha-galactosidase; [Source:UniProtKB/TrEMBL;Acc:Q5AU92] [Aspergillus nidulans FGSC A4]|eukprot:XP_681407.1 AGLC_ASPNG Alpha-galactosidase C precursor (Melibiase) [Aspergillus nidulans FGSC A4]